MEKTVPSITVIIPARNSRNTLAEVMAPLLAEITDSDEIIVVDDRSGDGTGSLAREMGARVVPSTGRPGAAGARNSGAAHAKGDWLLFVDSDAVAPAGWREKLLSRVKEGCTAVQASYSPRAAGEGAATFYKNFYYFYTFTRRIKTRHIRGCGTFFFAVERMVFESLGGFDDNIPGATVEDADFAARLAGAGHRILLAPEILVFHLREYTFPDLMRYDWRMMVSKTLYFLRRDSSHGSASVSMASPAEMKSLLLGAPGIWLIPAGLAAAAEWSPGLWIAAAGSLLVAAGHAAFWFSAVRRGGLRGLRASLLTLPDLALVLPALAAGCIRFLGGRRY